MVTRRRTARKKRTQTANGRFRADPGAPARRGGGGIILVLGALVLVNLYVFVWNKETSVGAIKARAAAATPTPAMVPGAPLESGAAAAPVRPAVAPVAPAPAAVAGCPVAGATSKVQKGDTLGRALKHRAGLTADESDGVIRALSPVFDFKMLRAGQVVTVERTADGKLLRVILAAKDGTVFAERAPTGGFVGAKGSPCRG